MEFCLQCLRHQNIQLKHLTAISLFKNHDSCYWRQFTDVSVSSFAEELLSLLGQTANVYLESLTSHGMSALQCGDVYLRRHVLSLSVQIMSQEQWESVAVSVESLLSDAKRMQLQCRERSEQLSMAATQLRVESAALREQCEASQLDMARIRRQLDELMDTKAAFEARERQARKLSKQLWEEETWNIYWSVYAQWCLDSPPSCTCQIKNCWHTLMPHFLNIYVLFFFKDLKGTPWNLVTVEVMIIRLSTIKSSCARK